MRATLTIGAVLAALAAGCTTTGIGRGESPSPPETMTPETTTPEPTVTPSPTPESTPPPDGALEIGAASIALTGDLTVEVGLPTLVEPDVWSAPPGPMDLTWDEPRGQSLSLSGTAFASRASTSEERRLTFVVDGPSGTLEFTSAGGECSITITPALPDNMGGVFRCTSLIDASGAFTVEARGTFSATG